MSLSPLHPARPAYSTSIAASSTSAEQIPLKCLLGVFVMEPELESRYVHAMRKWYWGVGSVALCIATAGLLALVFRTSPHKGSLPLLFLAIIVLVTRFGSWPGILGTLGAAAVFALFLFEPVFSLRVSHSAQRGNLVWMALIGIVVSELLGVRPTRLIPPKG
jgi:K+-sensing histidine kinase KdpD